MAAKKDGRRFEVELDWYYVSKETLWRWVLLLVGAAILVSAGVYWWLNRGDDLAGRASREIAAADELLAKGRMAPGAVRAREEIAAAAEKLEKARASHARALYADALKEAVEARQLALRITSGAGTMRHDAADHGARRTRRDPAREPRHVGIGTRRDEALRGGLPEDGRQRPRRGHGGRRDLLPDQAGDPLRGPPRQDVRGGRRGRAEAAVGDQVHRRHRRHRHGRGLALHRPDGRRHGRHRLEVDRRRRRRPLEDDRRLRLPRPGHALHRVGLRHPRRPRARRRPRRGRRPGSEDDPSRPASSARPGRRRRLRPEPQPARDAQVDPGEGGRALPPPDRPEPPLHPRLDRRRRRPPAPGGGRDGDGGGGVLLARRHAREGERHLRVVSDAAVQGARGRPDAPAGPTALRPSSSSRVRR